MFRSNTFWFWAKLGDETWPTRFHPVVCHLLDVGQVALALWRTAFRPQVRSFVSARFGVSEDVAGRWLAFWVAGHDIGKLTPCFQFQGKTEELKRRLDEAGFSAGAGTRHHTDTGTRILASELSRSDEKYGIDRDLARKVAVAVGGHHGTFPTDWDDITAPLGDGRWAEARRDVLFHLARLFGIDGLPPPNPPHGADQSAWMYLAGLTSTADWIGSNAAFFPPFVTPERPLPDTFDGDEYFASSGKMAERALKELGWLGRAEPTGTAVSFERATGIATPRALQIAVIPHAQEMATTRTPQLIVVEAPMGEGKTEAAWYAADCWDRGGGQGTYIALPTMATSNQMFERVGKFLLGAGGKSNLMLLHGKAALNERFERLRFGVRVYDEDGRPSGVVAEGWFAANKKHGLLAPYGVGTIDQALLAVLQTKHMFVRLFGLAGKCVILDEVHAYDAYMTTLLERLLRWLATLGCPVVLLSATLPADKRLKLLRAYAGDDTPKPESVPYPRVTSAAVGGTPEVTRFEADPARRKVISLKWVEGRVLGGNLKTDLAAGGCAAVIRNTVGLAQETYLELKEQFAGTGVTVELFHARFPFGRRKQIEDDVLTKYGKGLDGKPENALRPKAAILVATQVIEQSLDLDFDLMYSDIAPVDLVLQRAGRLHRHDRGDRGPPRLRLITPGEKDGGPDFGPSEWVYARFVLLRSLVALRALPVVALPDDLERCVEQVYGSEPLSVPAHLIANLAASESALREEQRKQNRAAKGVTIWAPETEDLLEQPNQQLREDDPEAHEKIRAATRDTEPTVQLVVVHHRGGDDFLDAAGTDPFNPAELPDVKRLRRLLDNEVTISHGGCVGHYAREPAPPGWEKSGMLRHHRLLRVAEDGSSMTDNWLRVDGELGVVIQRSTATEGV